MQCLILTPSCLTPAQASFDRRRHFPAQHHSFYLLQHNYSTFKTLLHAVNRKIPFATILQDARDRLTAIRQVEKHWQLLTIRNSPEADPITENQTPLIRHSPSNIAVEISKISSPNDRISRLLQIRLEVSSLKRTKGSRQNSPGHPRRLLRPHRLIAAFQTARPTMGCLTAVRNCPR